MSGIVSPAIWQVAWSDGRANWLAWVGLAATMLAAGTGTAVGLAFLMEGNANSTEIGGSVLGFALMSVFVTTSTLAGLIVNERRATYARWKLAGMHGGSALSVILAQVAAVAAAFSAIGTVPAPLCVGQLVDLVQAKDADVGEPWVSPAVVAVGVAVCSVAAVLGATGKALSVASQSPVAVARGSALPRALPGFWATNVGLMIGGSTLAILLTLQEDSEKDNVVAVAVVVLFAMVCLIGCYIRPLLQWTRALRVFGPVAALAGGSTRVRSAFTSAQVTPWFLASGMVVGLGSSIKALGDVDGSVATGDLGLSFALLAPALVPALVAAIGSLCVMAPRMRSDALVLRRAGAARGQWVRSLAWEATAVTATAGILTILLAVGGVAMTNIVLLGSVFPAGWYH